MKRAVLDTNVMLASQKTASAHSPNAEIVRRWKAGEFTLLITDDLLQEYAEKLIEKGIEPALRRMLLRDLILLGEQVAIAFFHLRHYPVDPDDTPFLLAALSGSPPLNPSFWRRSLRSAIAAFQKARPEVTVTK
jgi:predicted nucleic acid-binding protein